LKNSNDISSVIPKHTIVFQFLKKNEKIKEFDDKRKWNNENLDLGQNREINMRLPFDVKT